MCCLSSTYATIPKYQCGIAMASKPMVASNSLPTQAPTTQKTKKKMTIASSVTVHQICESSSEMTAFEKSSCYYSPKELERFNQEVKDFRRTLAASSNLFPDGATYPTARNCLEAHEALRGLELHICQERLRNRLVAKQAVISYQKHLNSTNMDRNKREAYLAAISAKMSKWSNCIALETARLDSLAARVGDFDQVQGAIFEPVHLPPFPTLKRRIAEEDDCNGRRKRARCA